MTVYGVTDSGFVIKRQPQVLLELQAGTRGYLGDTVDLDPRQPIGQHLGIMSEQIASLWEMGEGVYNSAYPDSSSGVILDNVVSITGQQRELATYGSIVLTAYGTQGTSIPQGSTVSVQGKSSIRVSTITDYTIGAGIDEVQQILFSAVPDAGTWTVSWNGNACGTLQFNDVAATVQTALRAISGLSDVTVSGDYTAGFSVTFTASSGQRPQPLMLVATNTLTKSSAQVGMSVTEYILGVLPNVEMTANFETAGQIPVYAGTCTVIETPVSGWDSVINVHDATEGKNRENDPQLKIRRRNTVANPGEATTDSIKSRLLDIDQVLAARVYQNNGDTTDGDGRPPHSIEAVVLGGDDGVIAETIWTFGCGGIQTYGSQTQTITDSDGFPQDIHFNRPTQVPIYIIVNVTTNSKFPTGGDVVIKQNVANFGDENFSINDEVKQWELVGPVGLVLGIETIDIKIGTAPAPTLTNNIAIGVRSIAQFDTAFITVNVS